MGAFASLGVGAARFSAQAQILCAVVFALAMLFSTEGEAHLGLAQQAGFNMQPGASELRKDCALSLAQSRAWIRGAGTCAGDLSARVLPQRMVISGKVGEVLAAILYCRIGSALTQFTRKSPACVPLPAPPQRLLTAGNELAEWPADKLAPATDQGRIEAFAFGHLPDG